MTSRCASGRPAKPAGRPGAGKSANALYRALKPFASMKADDGDDFTVGYPDDVLVRIEASVGEIKAAREAVLKRERKR